MVPCVRTHHLCLGQRKGNVNGKTNGAELAGELNQNRKERTGNLFGLGGSLVAP